MSLREGFGVAVRGGCGGWFSCGKCEGKRGVGWGQAKERASPCAGICQNYPLANYPLVSPQRECFWSAFGPGPESDPKSAPKSAFWRSGGDPKSAPKSAFWALWSPKRAKKDCSKHSLGHAKARCPKAHQKHSTFITVNYMFPCPSDKSRATCRRDLQYFLALTLAELSVFEFQMQ